MKLKISKLISLTLALVIAFSLSACAYAGYKGEYSHLVAVTRTNVMGTKGYWFVGPNFKDPLIKVLETDKQGRQIFAYLEDREQPLSIVICQKSSGGDAYFYPHCFISYELPEKYYDVYNGRFSSIEFTRIIDELVLAEDLQKLKIHNDWGKEFNAQKCEKVKIQQNSSSVVNQNRNGELKVNISFFSEIFSDCIVDFGLTEQDFNGEKLSQIYYYCSAYLFCNKDEYGRELYFVSGYVDYESESIGMTYYLELAVIIQPDKTFIEGAYAIELPSKYNYVDAVQQLKQNNGWNVPFNGGEV